jgi:hypothetical protein
MAFSRLLLAIEHSRLLRAVRQPQQALKYACFLGGFRVKPLRFLLVRSKPKSRVRNVDFT